MQTDRSIILELATRIVVASIEGGATGLNDIPRLLESTIRALSGGAVEAPSTPKADLVPAVSVKRSVTADYIICLDDGKRFKSMKGHLRKLGMTPAQYREKWNLPADYPIVAPNYAASRSTLAKLNGLGTANSNREKAAGPKPLRSSGGGAG